MSHELIHCSVERGLRGGTGFAVAAVTSGLPPGLEAVLGELSAYDFDHSRATGADLVDWSHRLVSVQGRNYTVLSRVAPCGNDWSGRPNRIAHHLVIEPAERGDGGPAWMLAGFDGFAHEPPTVAERSTAPSLPRGALGPRAASAWRAAGLDPGWAGVVARTALDYPSSPIYLVFERELDLLPLMVDVTALMPVDRRWSFTFSTRFQRSPASARCMARCVRAGARGVAALLAEPGAKTVRVTGEPKGDAGAIAAAREGRTIDAAAIPSQLVRPVLAAAPEAVPRAAEVPPRRPAAARASPVPMPVATASRASAVPPPAAPATVVREPIPPEPPGGDEARSWTAPLVVVLLAYSLLATIVGIILLLR